MTCIVGLVDDGNVWLGGDSAISCSYEVDVKAEPKVFTHGSYLIGCSGDSRACQLVRYALKPPERKSGEDLTAFMTMQFAESVRQCMRTNGALSIEKNIETFNALFLVGVGGRLFSISSSFHVLESKHEYTAIGSGEEYAKGSLFTTGKIDALPARDRLELALQAAALHNAFVRPPFEIDYI